MDGHETSLMQVSGDGRELWKCLECGRLIIMDWRQGYNPRTVVNPGDEEIVHYGGKGGIMPARLGVTSRRPDITEDDREWLAELGIRWPRNV